MIILQSLFLIILVSIAMYTDIKENKIKNKHILIFLIIGILLSIIHSGINGLKDSLLGIIIPFILLFIFFALRMLGAGDIKLYCAIGSIMGVNFVLNNIIYSFFLAGIVVIFKLIFSKNLIKAFKGIYLYFSNMFLSQSIQNFENSVGQRFPFAIAIFLGTIVQLVLNYKFI